MDDTAPLPANQKEDLAKDPPEKARFQYWRQLLFFTLFVFVTPLTLFSSAISLLALNIPNQVEAKGPRGVQIYAALPQTDPVVSGSVIGTDVRVAKLSKYFELNDSPLAAHSYLLVTIADTYNLDWRLIPAIAQKESGGCHVIPTDSHNCWGWGIHSKGTLKFNTYEEGIKAVGKGLKENYIDKGYKTTDEIMSKYTHADSTTWATDVNMYMDQLKNFTLE